MPLQDSSSGRALASAIEEVSKSDHRWIASSLDFRFDWEQERGNEVYKISLLNEKYEVLGLISLIDVPNEYRIHLNVIETSDRHRGRKKTIENIAGCLIAFSCKLAFERQYDGFVSLQPKTKLNDYYQGEYGFRQYGRLLAVEQELSRKLILEYLSDEEN